MTADEVFNKYGIRKTMIRGAILSALMEKHEGLTYTELTNKIGSKSNKASVFRALSYFQMMGFVNKITFSGSRLRYYYTESSSCSYAYFSCMHCQKSYVLDVEPPVLILPGEMQIKKIEFIVSGICPECNDCIG